MSEFMEWLLTTKSDHQQEHAHLHAMIEGMTDKDRETFIHWLEDGLENCAVSSRYEVVLGLA